MGEVKQRVDLDLSGSISGLEKTANLIQDLNSKLDSVQKTSKTAFSNVADIAENYNKSLGDGVKVYGQIDQAAKQHQQTVQKLSGNMQSLDKSMQNIGSKGATNLKNTNTEATKLDKSILQLKIKMQSYQNIVEKATDTRIIEKYNRKLQDTEKQIQQLSNRGKKGFDDLGNSVEKQESKLEKFGKAIVGMFAIGAVTAWAKQIGTAILDVTKEFQTFEAILSTSLGSESAAQRAMMMIQDFAAKTPYAVNELTDAYVKLAGRGIRATTDQMTKLADVASATGKGMDQLVEAVNDVNNQERWKEFGIKVKTEGDKVIGSFRGMTVEVEKTEAGALKMIEAFGGMEGVAGSTEKVSASLAGQLSNLSDSVNNLFLTIGQQETGAMASFTAFLNEAVAQMTILVATTDQLAQKMAAGAVADFATKTEADFKKLAEETKKSGGDVQAALTAQSEAMRVQLEKDLEAARKVAKEFEGEASSILTMFANPTQYGLDKGTEAAAKASIKAAEEQLKALDDAQRFVLDDMAKAENAAAQKRAEKQAEDAKKAAAARLKAQQELNKLFEKMEVDAEKAKLNMLNKNSEQYLRALREYEMKQLQELEASIREKQRLAGLSPELNTEQQQQLRILALEIDKKYYDSLYKLQEQERDKLLDLQKDSDEKELQQLINKYDAEIRAAEEAGQQEVAIALKTAKEREKARLTRSQANKNIDFQEELSTQGALLDLNSLQGVDAVEIERLKQEKLLDLQIEFARKRLALIANETDDESILRQLQLKNMLAELTKQREDIENEKSRFSLQKLLGLDDQQMEAVTMAMDQTLGYVQEWTANMVALRQREVDSLSRQIDEKGNELNREILLAKEGFASNVATKQAEYDELKLQREKAMKDQQKAQRTQVLLDSALQVSNMVTSSTEIFKVMSPIPFVGVPLAIGMIAAMFGAFLAAKSKALQAASVPSFAKGGEGSLIKGPSHSQGGIDVVENRTGRKIANIEGGENFYVTNKKSTDKYWSLLEAINANDEKAISKLSLDWLLSGTGVITPNPETPQRLQNLQTSVKTAQTQAAGDRYAKEMTKYLGTIASNTRPQQQVIETETERIIKWGHNTRIVKK